jgi:predicted metal-dependent hydrolase
MIDDPRLTEAARLFNTREFFACHDVLEEVWSEALGPERDHHQGLIHAAVALYHFSEGNFGGARKMYHSAVRYLTAARPGESPFDLERLLGDLRIAFEPLLLAREYPTGLSLSEELIPVLHTAAMTEVPA